MRRTPSHIKLLIPSLLLLLLGAGASGAIEYRPVVQSPATDGAPTWAPDGERLAFSSKMSGTWDIYIVSAAGGEAEVFTEYPGVDIYPAWSPDGEWIAFSSRRDNGSGVEDMDLWMKKLSTDSLVCLTQWHGYDSLAAFDPSGRQIAFASDRSGANEIWVLSLDDLDNPRQVSHGFTGCYAPCWSPDGEWIAFSGRDPLDSDPILLLKVPAAGGFTEVVPTGFRNSSDPSWSPDGRYLAFGGNDLQVDWDLYLWDLQEETLIQLSSTRYAEQSPVWNAAGSEIAYASLAAGNKDIWVAYDLGLSTALRRTGWSDLKRRFGH